MRLNILSTIEPGLYPSQSEHQEEIEQYFGSDLLPDLSSQEIDFLNNLDIFFVLFTNRCGSTFLTEIMHQIGLGVPPKTEVFNSDLLISCCRDSGILSFKDYFIRLVTGWSRQNQAGFKIGAQQLFWLTRTGLLSHCKSVRIVNSERQDKVSQAVSLYIARQTGQWHSEMKSHGHIKQVPYCPTTILQCLHSIHHGQQLINYYVDMHNTPCMSIFYENTIANPDRETERLAHFLNTPLISKMQVNIDAIGIKQQRTDNNTRLLEQFKHDFFTGAFPAP